MKVTIEFGHSRVVVPFNHDQTVNQLMIQVKIQLIFSVKIIRKGKIFQMIFAPFKIFFSKQTFIIP